MTGRRRKRWCGRPGTRSGGPSRSGAPWRRPPRSSRAGCVPGWASSKPKRSGSGRICRRSRQNRALARMSLCLWRLREQSSETSRKHGCCRRSWCRGTLQHSSARPCSGARFRSSPRPTASFPCRRNASSRKWPCFKSVYHERSRSSSGNACWTLRLTWSRPRRRTCSCAASWRHSAWSSGRSSCDAQRSLTRSARKSSPCARAIVTARGAWPRSRHSCHGPRQRADVSGRPVAPPRPRPRLRARRARAAWRQRHSRGEAWAWQR
mmetsp:Transcript_7263/g.15103  ORF Transcript_7263/g.15103 Transcript_7263/m.15103 type:complete len:265 (+) Transcript_7263:297-1091(+)